MKYIYYLILMSGIFFMPELSARSSAMRGFFGGAGTGALIGGLAGGGRGAGYGALAGGVLGTTIGASEDAKRRRRYRYYNDYDGDGYYEDPYVNYANGSAYGPYVNYADGPEYVNYAESYTQQAPRRRGGYARRSSGRRGRSGRNRRTR